MTEPHFPSPESPWLMGVLNVTPDSFSDGGDFIEQEAAIAHAHSMVREGAHIIDVGGESTRPGAPGIDAEEEWARIGPVVRRLAKRDVRVSVDTSKPDVAQKALEAGAWMINDVNGLRDPDMLDLVGLARCHVCIMHMQGDPRTMQHRPEYDDVVKEVCAFLAAQAEKAIDYGVPRERVCVDPGIGFGKNIDHNLALIRHLEEIAALGFPVLVGASRKSFIGKLLGSESEPVPVRDRLEGTIAAGLAAIRHGASVLRVHDVEPHRRALAVWQAVYGSRPQLAENSH